VTDRKFYTGLTGDIAELPENIRKALDTPHDHEGPNNPPLWIFWKQDIGRDGITDGPTIDSIANSPRSAEYHARVLLDDVESRSTFADHGQLLIHVERVPANHRFGHADFKAFEEFAQRRSIMVKFR